jgi:hypothetical protein
MVLENICGPVILYLGFSLVQIVVDIYKNLYNSAFLKFVVMIVFAVILNILCNMGLTIISWFLVFIPFIFMTFITSVLLFVFGLNPDQGNADYILNDKKAAPNSLFAPLTANDNRTWRVFGQNNQTTTIRILNGNFTMFDVNYQLKNTNPISFALPDGSSQIFVSMDKTGNVTWRTTSQNLGYTYLYWTPISNSNIPGVPTPLPVNPTILGPGGEQRIIPAPAPAPAPAPTPIPTLAPAQPLNPVTNVVPLNEISCDFQCISTQCLDNNILNVENCVSNCKKTCKKNL